MRSSRISSGSAVAALVAAAIAASGSSWAQGAAPGLSLEEVTVTARKVEENLMEVPLAITAFSEKAIEDQGIKQLTDVMRFTPSFNFVNQQGGSGRNDRSASALVFRGLFLGNNVGTTAGGQLFVDGAPVFGAQPPPIADVARIEVLKGPQSAYFGRSTFAGALNFIMKEPGDDFGGKLSVEGSSWGSHDASLSLEAPIGDTLGARVTIRDFKRGGYYKNRGAQGGELGEQTTQSLSGSIVWRPTDDLKIKFHGSMFEDDDGPPAQGALKPADASGLVPSDFTGRVDANGNCVPFSQAPAGTAALGQAANSRASFGYWCGQLPGASSLERLLSGDYNVNQVATNAAVFNPNPNFIIFGTGFKRDGGVRRKASQADLRVDWQFAGGYSLSSLTATHFDKTMTVIDLNYRDATNLPNPFLNNPMNPACVPATCVPWRQFIQVSQGRLRDVSQELRLTSPTEARFRWTTGVNYIDLYTPGGPVYGIAPVGPIFSAGITEQKVRTPSAFAGLYFDLTDTLTISGEARYQEDQIKQTPKIGTSGQVVTGVAAQTLKAKYYSFNPRVSLDWNYSPDSTLYALYSKGTRPGGFNAALVTSNAATIAALQAVVPNAGLAYDEEELVNYEVGWKSTWFDGRARTQLTVYKDDWKNGQVSSSVPISINGTNNLIGLVVNNGTAALQGVEFEGEVRITEALKVGATAAYNKTEVKSFGIQANGLPNCTDCNNAYGSFAGVIGNELPTAPKVTFSLSADYSHQLTSELDWFARADLTHQGKKYTDLSNVAWVGASDLVNLKVGVRNEKYTIEAFVNNVTDDDTLLSALPGTEVFSFGTSTLAGAGTAGIIKGEFRFSPPMPRAYGIRFGYNF